MKDLYVTSTLHTDWNIQFNIKLSKAFEKHDIKCYLPQRDTEQNKGAEIIFKQNTKAIHRSEYFMGVAKNFTPNFGAEIGYAYGLDKKIVLLTDDKDEIPMIIKSMSDSILEVKELDNVDDYIDKLINLIKNE